MIPAKTWQWYIFEVQVPTSGDADKTTVDATLTNLNGKASFEVCGIKIDQVVVLPKSVQSSARPEKLRTIISNRP